MIIKIQKSNRTSFALSFFFILKSLRNFVKESKNDMPILGQLTKQISVIYLHFYHYFFMKLSLISLRMFIIR